MKGFGLVGAGLREGPGDFLMRLLPIMSSSDNGTSRKLEIQIFKPALTSDPLSEVMTDLVDPLASLRGYLAAEKSTSTRRCYAADFADFAAWCESWGVPSLPASPLDTAQYLSGLADRGLKVSTISRQASAIRYAHLRAGHDPPTPEGVKAALRGIRRTLGSRSERKAPATAVVMADMLAHAPDTMAGKRDRARHVSTRGQGNA